jgi:Arc/MetJ-type ribon-helix-helix transcriptional regulator
MVRTQIYLTEEQQKALRRRAASTRKKQSELIRQAIDQYLAQPDQKEERLRRLRQGWGLWKDRNDLPDFAAIRKELDRSSDR